MTTRTTKKTVTFIKPFVLGDSGETHPAGTYTVETDEEILEGYFYSGYRRTATLIHMHAKPGRPGITQTLDIDPEDLEAALRRDALPAPRS